MRYFKGLRFLLTEKGAFCFLYVEYHRSRVKSNNFHSALILYNVLGTDEDNTKLC
jgi:hypothetical protein